MVKRRRKDKGEARNFLDHLGSLELSFFLIDDGSKRHWLTQKNDRAKKVVIGHKVVRQQRLMTADD